MNFSMVLTQYCNLHCDHCYLPSLPTETRKGDDLGERICREALESIGRQYADIVEEIYITGGEFLTLSYGDNVVDMVRRAFPTSQIYAYTNGIIFLQDKDLFKSVCPDVFHVGLDEWHGTIAADGSSKIADLFLEYRHNSGNALLVFHWTRKDGDEDLFNMFVERYGHEDVVIEDRSLNTTTGRAKTFERPRYREDEVWRPCDFGKHVLMKYDRNCYACHYAIPNSIVGDITAKGLRKASDKLLNTDLGEVLHDEKSSEFYVYVCRNNKIEYSSNRCLLCEDFANNGIDMFKAAKEWRKSDKT